MNRKGIIIFQRVLPHYRTQVFRKLTRKLGDVTVLYGQPAEGEAISNDTSVLPENFIKVRNNYLFGQTSLFHSEIFDEIRRRRPAVVISVFNIGNLNIYKLLAMRKKLGFRLILWSFGYDPARGFEPRSNMTDRVRLFLSQKADAVIFYWNKGRELSEFYSRKKQHYFTAPNTLDTDKLTELKGEFDLIGRDKIRKELGISEAAHFVYVGRLLADKEIEILIKAFDLYSETDPDSRLTIVGGGPEEAKLRKLAVGTGRKIVFTGEETRDEVTGKWLYVSDAMVMPGRLGLSVVHSFCFGTPVISQNKSGYFHGEGVGYIKDGINGYLATDGDAQDLAGKMKLTVGSGEKMRQEAFGTASGEASIQSMCRGFEDAVKYVLSLDE